MSITYEGYEATDYDEVAEALKEIRRQYLAGEDLNWTGPDRLHHSISAGCPPASVLFSPESLAHEAERGRDFWDVYSMVAFQLGFHNGVVRECAKLANHYSVMRRLEAPGVRP